MGEEPAKKKGPMAFVIVEKVKWVAFLEEGRPWVRWTVPVTSSAEGCLDLVAMLIGTGGAREDSLSVLHVHMTLLTGAMSKKSNWQTFSGEIPVNAVETDYDVVYEDGRHTLRRRGSPKDEIENGGGSKDGLSAVNMNSETQMEKDRDVVCGGRICGFGSSSK